MKFDVQLNNGSFTPTSWGSRPSAVTSGIGAVFLCSDIGSSPTLMISNGTYWRPINGIAALVMQSADITTVANATEQIFGTQVTIPGNFLQVGCKLRSWISCSKSSTADTMTVRVRLGTAGTTADAQIVGTSNQATTNVSLGWWAEIHISSATSARKLGNASSLQPYPGVSASAIPATVTIPNISNTLVLSTSSQSSLGTETNTLYGQSIEIIFP